MTPIKSVSRKWSALFLAALAALAAAAAVCAVIAYWDGITEMCCCVTGKLQRTAHTDEYDDYDDYEE